MNIVAIKTQIATEQSISLPTLEMVRQFNQVPDPNDPTKMLDEKAPWLSHWDNTNRVRVTMHEDVLARLKADPNANGLALKSYKALDGKMLPYEIVESHVSNGANIDRYIRYVVITPANIEASL